MKKLRIGIVDDHPLMREGIARTLNELTSQIDIVATGGTADDALNIAREHSPDVLLLDVSIPGGGIEAAYSIADKDQTIAIVMLTVSERPSHVTAALAAGAKGYILKGISGQDLLRAIQLVSQGQSYVSPELAGQLLLKKNDPKEPLRAAPRPVLTAREEKIADLLGRGKTNREIAEILNLREKTIKHYMTNIFQKLGVRNRVEAVLAMRKKIDGSGSRPAPLA
jgi:two-component system nitrate/nitrite response regulator NarL